MNEQQSADQRKEELCKRGLWCDQWVTTPQLQRGRPYDGAVERNGTLVIPRDPFERCCICGKKNPCKGHKP